MLDTIGLHVHDLTKTYGVRCVSTRRTRVAGRMPTHSKVSLCCMPSNPLSQASLDWPRPDQNDITAYVERNKQWFDTWTGNSFHTEL